MKFFVIEIKGWILFISMKVAVCVLGQLRYPELTWPGFKKYVLDELGADLIVCGPDTGAKNEYTRNAKHLIPSEATIGPDAKCNADAIIQHRKALYLNASFVYDQYILTRADHMWMGPHPHLDTSHIWFMNCEFHFGISDRHTVVPHKHLRDVTQELGTFSQFSNIESYLYYKLKEQGLWGPTVGLAHFTMYLTGEKGEMRRPDELHAPLQNYTWPFEIDHGHLSPNGMFCGRIKM